MIWTRNPWPPVSEWIFRGGREKFKSDSWTSDIDLNGKESSRSAMVVGVRLKNIVRILGSGLGQVLLFAYLLY
jgi:hypothetical protein